MGIESAKTGKLLYHLTKLNNLQSIVENGLVPRKALLESGVIFDDVANPDIINKRTQLGLDMYTPFHFHPYSSFDVAVKHTFPHDEFIYICITRSNARHNNFKILPKHPLSIDECTLLEYDEGFSKIDWPVLTQKGLTDEYAKHVKMAECLTELRVPAKFFHSIDVKSEQTKQVVEEILRRYGINENPPYVNVRNWF
ncbi:DarT ssDNA thymidine ADP-ribosyltransferase family protein [Paenibacillus thiaminolyticus]|uniref:DarT ssDNA thymidine ADP-ribosyltransferase family protein n=1 Tax=Paenibacillus thiaminolyticus TaxID=49283 RepID=UPI003D281D66